MSFKIVIRYSVLALACVTLATAVAVAEEKGEKKKIIVGDPSKTEKLVGADSFNLVSTLGQYGQVAAVQTLPDVVAPYYANHYTYSKYLVPTYGIAPVHGYGHGHGHGVQYGYDYPHAGYYAHGHGHGHGHGFGHNNLAHGNVNYGFGSTIGHILAYNTYRPTAYNYHGHQPHGHYNQLPIYYTHNYDKPVHGLGLAHGHGDGYGIGHGLSKGYSLSQSYGVPLYNNRHHRFGLYH